MFRESLNWFYKCIKFLLINHLIILIAFFHRKNSSLLQFKTSEIEQRKREKEKEREREDRIEQSERERGHIKNEKKERER